MARRGNAPRSCWQKGQDCEDLQSNLRCCAMIENDVYGNWLPTLFSLKPQPRKPSRQGWFGGRGESNGK